MWTSNRRGSDGNSVDMQTVLVLQTDCKLLLPYRLVVKYLGCYDRIIVRQYFDYMTTYIYATCD
jgi:hypothetical protein